MMHNNGGNASGYIQALRCGSPPTDAWNTDMNWEAIGAVGEVLGAIGVIVTLGYLAVQIRQNTRQIEFSSKATVASATQEFFSRLDSFQNLLIESDRAARSWASGMTGEVDRAELASFEVLAIRFYRLWETFFLQHQEGLIADDLFESVARRFDRFSVSPGLTAIWKAQSEDFTPAFVEYLGGRSVSRAETGTGVDT